MTTLYYGKRMAGDSNSHESIKNSTRKYTIKILNTYDAMCIYTNEKDYEKFDKVIFNFMKNMRCYSGCDYEHPILICCSLPDSHEKEIWYEHRWFTTYQLKSLIQLIRDTGRTLDYCNL